MQTIYIIAPIFSRSGYGQHSRLIVDALIKMGTYKLIIHPTRWGGTPSNQYSKYDQYVLYGQLTEQPDISIQVGLPDEFQRIGKMSIGVSAVTESSVCSLEFLEGTNRVDMVLVPSEFTKKILTETIIEKRDQTGNIVQTIQCTVPVHVLFEGVDTEIFNNKNVKNTQLLSDVKEDFCFLVVGAWLQGIVGEDRKNISGALHLFLDVFKRKGKNKRPAIILKTHGAGYSEIEKHQITERIKEIQRMVGGDTLPSVYLVNGNLSDSEMNDLYNHPKVKAILSLSHGEGYNLPLSEFKTTGKPDI